jgi:hypothetical protein
MMPDVGNLIAGIMAAVLAQAAPHQDQWRQPIPPVYRPPLIAPVPWPQPMPRPQSMPSSPPRPALPPQQNADAADRAEEAEAKRATLDFCNRHPREYFCTRLEAYLQKHPQLR